METNLKKRKFKTEATDFEMTVAVDPSLLENSFENSGPTTCTLMSQKDSGFEDHQQRIQNINIPVLDVVSVTSNEDFQKLVLFNFNKLFQEIAEIKQEVKNIQSLFREKNVVHEKKFIDFVLKYNLELPLKTIDEFNQFDQLLKVNELFRSDVCTELGTCIDKDDVLTRTIVAMLKKFLTKKVAIGFTAVRIRRSIDTEKLMQEKKIFKGTEFCKCIDATIIGHRIKNQRHISEKDLIKALSDVLCNARNWHE